MRATHRTTYGPPDVLSVRELPVPEPTVGELLIRVQASTVNRTDCGVLFGAPYVFRFFVGWPKPRLASTGTDFAGVVEAVGRNVTRFKLGDRIWGFDDHGIGSHAEYFTCSEKAPILAIPDGIGFDLAAASGEGAHYAYTFLRCMTLKPGDRVMVNGGTGAIGSAAIQMLRQRGARVTATCATPHLDRVAALGAERVIDYTRESFTEDPEQYSYVLDAVGKSSFGACKRLLLPGGVYFSSELGPGNENLYLPLTTRFSSRRYIFPIPADIPRTLAHVQGLLQSGAFRPLMDRSFPLAQVQDAFRYVASGQKVGNVLLTLGPSAV